MTLNVNSQLESRIQSKLETGNYANVEQLLSAALDSLDYQSDQGESLTEFLAGLDEAEAQADRGETFTGEDVSRVSSSCAWSAGFAI